MRAGDEASDAAATKIAQNHCFCKDAQPSLRSAPRELCVHPRPNRCLPRQFLFFRSPTCSLCPFIFFRRLVQPRDGLQSIRFAFFGISLLKKSQCSQSRNNDNSRQGARDIESLRVLHSSGAPLPFWLTRDLSQSQCLPLFFLFPTPGIQILNTFGFINFHFPVF